MSRRPWSPLSYHQCTFLFLGVQCLYRSTDNWRLFGYLLCRYLAWEPKRCLMSPLVVTELIHKASLLICIYEAHGFLWRPYLNLFISCSLCGEKKCMLEEKQEDHSLVRRIHLPEHFYQWEINWKDRVSESAFSLNCPHLPSPWTLGKSCNLTGQVLSY